MVNKLEKQDFSPEGLTDSLIRPLWTLIDSFSSLFRARTSSIRG
jgi:hypothetical protein